MNISIETISFAGIGVGAITTLLYKLKVFRRILGKVSTVLTIVLEISYEIEDFAETLEKALEDNTLTKDEIQTLKIKALRLRNTILELRRETGL